MAAKSSAHVRTRQNYPLCSSLSAKPLITGLARRTRTLVRLCPIASKEFA
jgi:hypothetical protein